MDKSCVKCGFHSVKMTFERKKISIWNKSQNDLSIPFVGGDYPEWWPLPEGNCFHDCPEGEHMHEKCPKCGYFTTSKPVDQENEDA